MEEGHAASPHLRIKQAQRSRVHALTLRRLGSARRKSGQEQVAHHGSQLRVILGAPVTRWPHITSEGCASVTAGRREPVPVWLGSVIDGV